MMKGLKQFMLGKISLLNSLPFYWTNFRKKKKLLIFIKIVCIEKKILDEIFFFTENKPALYWFQPFKFFYVWISIKKLFHARWRSTVEIRVTCSCCFKIYFLTNEIYHTILPFFQLANFFWLWFLSFFFFF